MAFLSLPRTNLHKSLIAFCFLAEILGVRVGEMYGFKRPASRGHNPKSLHYGQAGGYGYAADLNQDVPGINPSSERPLLIRALKIARSLGLATTFALEGTQGSAAAHKHHLHVDIAGWSNLGLGLERARVVKYQDSETFIVTPAVGLIARASASTLSRKKTTRPKGYRLTIKEFKVAGKYLWGKATDGFWYALLSTDGKNIHVKAGN